MGAKITMKRIPQFNGAFYENDPRKLRIQIAEYFNAMPIGTTGDAGAIPLENTHAEEITQEKKAAKFIMLPHAGHVYSGAVCAQTLREVKMASTVIILGPNHSGQGKNCGVWHEGAWETPFGEVPIAAHLAHSLLEAPSPFVADTLAHASEHSIEVILPFLSYYIPDLEIVPITISSLDKVHDVSHVLAQCIQKEHIQGREVSLVVSSDMNHFANDAENRRKDSLALDKLLQGDVEGLFRIVRDESISMCGVLPAIVGLLACKELGINSTKLAAYDTSARASGDYENVVGYAGVYMW